MLGRPTSAKWETATSSFEERASNANQTKSRTLSKWGEPSSLSDVHRPSSPDAVFPSRRSPTPLPSGAGGASTSSKALVVLCLVSVASHVGLLFLAQQCRGGGYLGAGLSQGSGVLGAARHSLLNLRSAAAGKAAVEPVPLLAKPATSRGLDETPALIISSPAPLPPSLCPSHAPLPSPAAAVAVAAAAAADAPLPRQKREGVVPLDDDGLAYTQQTCYMDSDESETCVFDDVMCFDGTSPVMIVGHAPRTEPLIDSLNDCMDFRYLEPSVYEFGECKYATTGERFYDPSTHPKEIAHDSGLLSAVRYWGPPNRHQVFFREQAATDIFGRGGAYAGVEVLEPARFTHPSIEGLQLSRRTHNSAANLTIDWLDGGLWLAALPGQSWANPYHWLSAMVAPLYAARRNNATGPWGSTSSDGVMHTVTSKDGGPPGTVPTIWRDKAPSAAAEEAAGLPSPEKNHIGFRFGAQWDLPSMDVVVGIGDSGREIENVTALHDWFAGTLRFAVADHTRVFFNDLMKSYSRNHLLCAPRGVLPSLKPRMFSGMSDAWVWRQRMHMAVGLDPAVTRSHPRLPPRFITVVDRSGLHGRGIFNGALLRRLVEETGLPFRILPKLDSLSFKEQVELMSQTGLLIAPHGAQLANVIFMPARSAVIELFPPLMKKNTYRNLATTFGLHYFPVYSRHLLPPNVTDDYLGQKIMTYPEFRDECIKTNISCYESLTQSHCNWASKTYAVLVPKRQFSEALRDALDAIGAFSWLNPEWAEIVKRDGIPPPEHLQAMDGWGDSIE